MVDIDKVKDRVKGDGDNQEKTGTKSPKSKKSKAKSKGTSSNSGKQVDRGKSQKEKLDEFKKASGVPVDSGSNQVTAGEFAKALETVSNIYLFVEGSKLESEDVDSKRKRFENEVYRASLKEYKDVISRNQIQKICERYDVDWKTDVVERVIRDQDIDGDVERMQDTSNYVVNIPRGKKVKLEDFHRVCIAVGEMIGFPRAVKRKIGNPSSNKQKVMRATASEVSAKCVDFAGLFGLPNICENNGIDWGKDVMEKVGAK